MYENYSDTHPLRRLEALPEGDWKITWRQRLWGIQNKIIIPFFTITLLVAIVGTYIVTRLVAGSLQERLSNQIIESGRVSGDSLVRIERSYLETLRLMALSSDVDRAIAEDDWRFLAMVVNALADNAQISEAAVLDARGRVLLTRGSLGRNEAQLAQIAAVQAVLAGRSDSQGDKFANIAYSTRPPLLTLASPVVSVADPSELAGVMVVAMPVADLLTRIKQEALADVILYDLDGAVVDSTFVFSDAERAALTLEGSTIQAHLVAFEQAQSQTTTITVNERPYQGIYVPLRVRGEVQGVMAVFLPSEFIVLAGGASARIFAALFTIATLMIIIIGLLTAATIVSPVSQLVGVAQEVTKGDLTRRAALHNRDEIGFLGHTFDLMTERLEQRNRQLEAEAARLNSILATSATGMVMINLYGELAFMNHAAWNFLQPRNDPEALDALCRYLLTLELRDRLEMNNFILEIQRTRVLSESQEPVGTLIALHDITQQELAGQLKDQFIARVSHELRTPLAAIKGFSDVIALTVELGKTPKAEHLQGIATQSELLNNMIIELLSITQMNAGTFSVRGNAFDLRDVLLDVVENEKKRITESQLSLNMHISPDPCMMKGDSDRIRWALRHLLDNAIKYNQVGGTVTCELSGAIMGEYHLVVTDTGAGIRAVDRPYIFDAFYRREAISEGGEVIDPRGMGLGLFIVKKVIEAHNGKVMVESSLTQGSKFILLLPAG